jgi:hypothetical protein
MRPRSDHVEEPTVFTIAFPVLGAFAGGGRFCNEAAINLVDEGSRLPFGVGQPTRQRGEAQARNRARLMALTILRGWHNFIAAGLTEADDFIYQLPEAPPPEELPPPPLEELLLELDRCLRGMVRVKT